MITIFTVRGGTQIINLCDLLIYIATRIKNLIKKKSALIVTNKTLILLIFCWALDIKSHFFWHVKQLDPLIGISLRLSHEMDCYLCIQKLSTVFTISFSL